MSALTNCSKRLEEKLEEIRQGTTGIKVDLSNCDLMEIPTELLLVKDSLEFLNLGNNHLSDLPSWFCEFQHLKILFFGENNFVRVPILVGKLQSLTMLSFKSNKLTEISEEALGVNLNWLILTDNRLQSLPGSFGNLTRLQKLMLAGNFLTELPLSMKNCQYLELLRISNNRLARFPEWLLSLPRLSWLAFGGNDFVEDGGEESLEVHAYSWADLTLQRKIGEGASGTIYEASVANNDVPVAIKMFKGEMTSDGLPVQEMKITASVGVHAHILPVLGTVDTAPNNQKGLVFRLLKTDQNIPVAGDDGVESDPILGRFNTLGGPPSFDSITRDIFPHDKVFPMQFILSVLFGIASALSHLHERYILHGDVYAHNILVNVANGYPILSDFGASSFFSKITNLDSRSLAMLERIEVRAFGCLIEDLLDRSMPVDSSALLQLRALQEQCKSPLVADRPPFTKICAAVKSLQLKYQNL